MKIKVLKESVESDAIKSLPNKINGYEKDVWGNTKVAYVSKLGTVAFSSSPSYGGLIIEFPKYDTYGFDAPSSMGLDSTWNKNLSLDEESISKVLAVFDKKANGFLNQCKKLLDEILKDCEPKFLGYYDFADELNSNKSLWDNFINDLSSSIQRLK